MATAVAERPNVVKSDFTISAGMAAQCKDYFLEHMLAIVRDALEGQCSHGHSCHESSREKLEEIQ